MSNFKILWAVDAVLALVAGVLISKMSFIGRMGINIAYKEYTIFKSWWQTALAMFAIQALLLAVQWLASRRLARNVNLAVLLSLLAIGVIGLYITYHDFNHTFSHRLLNEKFHLGFYLFWIMWLMGNMYFLTINRGIPASTKIQQ